MIWNCLYFTFILEGYFDEFEILCWQLFSLTLKDVPLFPSLHGFWWKAYDNFSLVLIYIMQCFSLIAFKIFSFSLLVNSLTIIYWGMGFFKLILFEIFWASRIYEFISFKKFKVVSGTFLLQNVFPAPFSLSVRHFEVISQVPEILLILFNFFHLS